MPDYTALIEARPFCAFDNSPLERLHGAGVETIDMRGLGTADQTFLDALPAADAIICGNDLQVDDGLLDAAPGVRVVAKLGAGLDTVDVDACTRHRAIVFHTPGANNQAVADHTFALILAVARRLLFCDSSLRQKRWEHTKIMGLEIWQKTIGLIGLGAIGRCVALRAMGFRMKVVAHDPFWPEDFAGKHEIERVSVEKLLRISDVVSIHAPLTAENKGLIDAAALRSMKPGAILINAARGGIVNEADLYSALKEGAIAGAGIDVFEQEPPTESPLLGLENVVLTPHTAAFTYEGMNNMSAGVVDQLIGYLNGRKPPHLVNPDAYVPYENS